MSYVESFETEMSRARIRMADYNSPYLDHLQAAHDAEMKQLSKEEFHRGYRSGIDARDAKQWQLDRKRQRVVCRLRKFEPWIGGKPTEEASKLIRCIIGREDCHVACGNDLEEARDRLIALLGTQDAQNATFFAGNQQNGPKLGEKPPEMQRDEPKSRDSLQEVESPSITDELRDYLDKNGQEYESFGGAEVATIKGGTTPLYEIADRIDAQFARICSQHEAVLQQTISETVDEHGREMAELRAELEDAQALIADNANDWTAYRMAQRERDSLLDLLRDAREEYKMLDRMLVETSANFHAMRDRVWGLEAERDELKANLDESVTNQVELEEDFNSVRRQWDECEEWCNELLDKLAEYESCGLAQTHRTLRRMLGEVKNLHDTLKAKVDAKPRVTEERDKYRKLAKRNEQWCDALVDLIRDAAKDYRTAAKVARRLQDRAFELRHERDELLDLLRDAASEYQESQMWEQVFRDHLACMREQRDDLQSQLQAVRDVIDGTQQDDG